MPGKYGRILVVDDSQAILKSLEQLLKYDFEEIKTISNPALITNLVSTKKYDVVLLDMNFKAGINSGNEGFYWMREILNLDVNAVVILITAYADIDLAVKAMKEGAVDFVAKPWDPAKLIATLQAAVQFRKSKLEVKKLKTTNQGLSIEVNRCADELIGSSARIKEVLGIVNKVAPTDANVLIVGENGTGKELIARRIHQLSARFAAPFISVDVGSLSESLFESELFGHEKGSFTDAKVERAGRFEIASNGTLFLDEIGNIPLTLQSKLLTVLENRHFTRIGSNSPIETNFRLISATNLNLNQLVHGKYFREDLLFRINTIQIELPPLRERKEDIPLIAEYYLKRYSKKYSKPISGILDKAMEKLIQYSWPGNIRELCHAMERSVILNDSKYLGPDCFLFSIPNESISESNDSLKLEDMEKQLLLKVLKQTGGNIAQAAKVLDISRTTLYSKMQKHGL